MRRGDLRVGRHFVIPATELRETASRASGPGGQHVNKTSTRVTLRWNVAASAAPSDAQRRRLLARLARLSREGEIAVHAQRFRSQSRNRALARERLAERVEAALAVRRRRVATRPTRASKERALAAKHRRAQTKQRRTRPRAED